MEVRVTRIEGEAKPGPPWDFDLGWRYTADGKNALEIGFKDTKDRLWELERPSGPR